jgi:hypothetical protein
LKDVLGVVGAGEEGGHEGGQVTSGKGSESGPDIEAAMLAAEDDEDIAAMRGAKEEIAKELDEFDEDAALESGDPDLLAAPAPAEAADGSLSLSLSLTSSGSKEAKPSQLMEVDGDEAEGNARRKLLEQEESDERDMEREFATWQAKIGPDFSALENALKPIERYALRYRTEVDPYYSLFFISDQLKLEALQSESQGDEWDVEEIEKEKEEEEFRALNEGELIATNMSSGDVAELRKEFVAERRRRKREMHRRRVTGAGWVLYVEHGVPFWYNTDTGEASYRTPQIIAEQERYKAALERRFNAMPAKIMVTILSFLSPWPDRMR